MHLAYSTDLIYRFNLQRYLEAESIKLKAIDFGKENRVDCLLNRAERKSDNIQKVFYRYRIFIRRLGWHDVK
jgi:hypothetical protein